MVVYVVVIRERLEYYEVDYYQNVFRTRDLAQEYINGKLSDTVTYLILEEHI